MKTNKITTKDIITYKTFSKNNSYPLSWNSKEGMDKIAAISFGLNFSDKKSDYKEIKTLAKQYLEKYI